MHSMFLNMLTPSKALSILTPVATGKKFSVSELGTDVINYISHATQQRLQDILEKVSHVAQQKNLTFKVIIDCNCRVGETHSLLCFKISCFIFLSVLASCQFQEDEQYEQASDVRTQLKFFEQLDQMEKQRKEEQEREILLKAAKVTAFEQGHTVSLTETILYA